MLTAGEADITVKITVTGTLLVGSRVKVYSVHSVLGMYSVSVGDRRAWTAAAVAPTPQSRCRGQVPPSQDIGKYIFVG